MKDSEQRKAAREFIKDWTGRGDEKQETQSFWRALLGRVFGVTEPEKWLSFELPVQLSHTSFIDAYIEKTGVLIEQKGRDIDLTKGYKQSDGSLMTPYQQARRYAGYLPHNKNPRWIVVSNFKEFHIYDNNRPNSDPEIVLLKDLEQEYPRLSFLTDTGDENIKKEMQLSIQAGELVGKLYDAFLKRYIDPTDPHTLKSLNALCVRLVFCLYAEDAGIFGKRSLFHDYIQSRGVKGARKALIELFRILDQPEPARDPYLKDDDPLLAAFPYVNGGLFSNENIEIPAFDQEIYDLLLAKASEDFNWSDISPTIFGAVFESTLNPETRRSGGMHYTSIENIHKVIDPLFLDDLKAELNAILSNPVINTRNKLLTAYQNKLASLKFLDPAAGSGNFLTETYLSLRKLENEVLKARLSGSMIGLGVDESQLIRVSIHQFYGIEINDFAVTVAKTALWIAESQMLKKTEEILSMDIDFLPLKSYANIVEGNALRLDWESVVPKAELNYIMGNPPFVGYSLQSKVQKDDILSVYVDEKGKPYKTAGKIDYVSGWYFKAAQLMQGTAIRTAFVSTNSITQGEQVAAVWKPLYDRFGIHIDFAHRTFRWDSEASLKAHVHCVIVGFSVAPNSKPKLLFTAERVQEVENINAYLVDAPDTFVESRVFPLCNIPKMIYGNKPVDGGNLIINNDDLDAFLSREPSAKRYIKRLVGAREFINGDLRWCLWLKGVSPSEIRNMPLVLDRVNKVMEMRKSSPDEGARKLALTPTTFRETNNPETAIVIPCHSSENRKYVPLGFIDNSTVVTNAVLFIPNAQIYHFGIITSNVHMAWMRTVCGRIKSDYRYSKEVVYNNFPWPDPTEAQRAKIEQTAQGILDARALYPDCSLADLYDEATMPPELRTAHQKNDRAVMEAYGFWGKLNSESACVAELMKLYQQLTAK